MPLHKATKKGYHKGCFSIDQKRIGYQTLAMGYIRPNRFQQYDLLSAVAEYFHATLICSQCHKM